MKNRNTRGMSLLLAGLMFARDTTTGKFFKAKVFPDAEVQLVIRERAKAKRQAKAIRRIIAASRRDEGYYRVRPDSNKNRFYPTIMCG